MEGEGMMYGSIIINMEEAQRQIVLLHESRMRVYQALKKTTTGSIYRRWKWARRAVPGFWALALRREMEGLCKDMRVNPIKSGSNTGMTT